MAAPNSFSNGGPPQETSPTSGLSAPAAHSPLDAIKRWTHKSYAGDYIGLALLIVAHAFLASFAEPFHQQFRLNDPRIQHPHAEHERVPVLALFLYATALPLALLTLYTLTLCPHKAHPTLLGLAITTLLTAFLTDVFKNSIGRPRPDLLARCKPAPGTPTNVLVDVGVCTETEHHTLHDGFRSFPSGHSSWSCTGLGWVALFLAAQWGVLRPRARLAAVLVALAPALGAAMIAVSRLEDYRHDVYDVSAGSLLGLGLAYFNWRRYWPSLRDVGCDEPYEVGAEGNGQGTEFQKLGDEEAGRFSIGEDER